MWVLGVPRAVLIRKWESLTVEYSEYPVRRSLVELDVSNNRIAVVEAERLLLLPQAPRALTNPSTV